MNAKQALDITNHALRNGKYERAEMLVFERIAKRARDGYRIAIFTFINGNPIDNDIIVMLRKHAYELSFHGSEMIGERRIVIVEW